MSASISVDAALGVAYVQLSEGRVTRSVESENGIVLDLNEFDVIIGVEIPDLSVAYSTADVKSIAHLNSADEERLAACLQALNRTRFTSGSLTDASKVQVRSQGGQALESC